MTDRNELKRLAEALETAEKFRWLFLPGDGCGPLITDIEDVEAFTHAFEEFSAAMSALSELTSERDALRARVEWQPIETAPKDCDIFVWFDHEADPYHDPQNPSRLTDYAAWADGGDFLAGKGFCIARWHTAHWESEDEYGNGYWLPAWWFARENDDYERVVNPTHWMPLPAPPALSPQQGDQP